jgi:hypothetical protein
MRSCVELSNEIKCCSAGREHLKNLINMIEESNDEQVKSLHDCNEVLNKTNNLVASILQLNLCQYSDASN